MRRGAARSSISAVAAFFVTAAVAQNAATDRDAIRDPEVLLPAEQQTTTGRPCVMEASVLQDSRIKPDVLRVMQTNPYFSHSDSRRKITRTVEFERGRYNTWTVERKYRSVGCGFYVEDTIYRYVSTVTRYDSFDVKTSLHGPGGELFSESKDTIRNYRGTEIKTDWSQMTTLEIIGKSTPVSLGNRYGKREATATKFGYGRSSSNECLVREQRPASEYNPRLTGSAFITTCKSESYYERDRSRKNETTTEVSFPDSPAPSFDPDKCRLEWRTASEFDARLVGDAFVTRCTAGKSSSVWLRAQGFSFNPDKCRFEYHRASEFHPRLTGDAFVARCTSGESSSVELKDISVSFNPDKCRFELRPASDFHPRLTGDAYVSRCRGDDSSVEFSDVKHLSFDPAKCRLQVRNASEFHPSIPGLAYAQPCAGSRSNDVWFPDLDESFSIDSIDGTFRTDPQQRKLLTVIEFAR